MNDDIYDTLSGSIVSLNFYYLILWPLFASSPIYLRNHKPSRVPFNYLNLKNPTSVPRNRSRRNCTYILNLHVSKQWKIRDVGQCETEANNTERQMTRDHTYGIRVTAGANGQHSTRSAGASNRGVTRRVRSLCIRLSMLTNYLFTAVLACTWTWNDDCACTQTWNSGLPARRVMTSVNTERQGAWMYVDRHYQYGTELEEIVC